MRSGAAWLWLFTSLAKAGFTNFNLHSPRGRLRYADQLRRPRWRNRQP
jgi:hypothetical protein